MVRSNDNSHGGSRAGYSDLSEFTTSTSATTQLQKLISLEIVGTNTSQSPEPGIIDLTQAPSDDYDDDDDDAAVAGGDDDDLTTCAVHQYVVTVLDDETVFAQSESVISQPSHREHATNDASTAFSSYLPNPYNEYTTSDYDHPVGHYRVPIHRPMTGVSSERGHYSNLRSHTNKTKNGRGNIVEQKPSVLGSLFQCVNPTLPGETDDMPVMWMAKSRVMEAMVSDEDALDQVFNTVEKYTCRNDGDIGREMRKELRQREDPEGRYAAPSHSGKSSYNCVKPDLSDYDCAMPGFSRWKASTRQRKPNKSEDMLDVVFGEMESYICSDKVNERFMHHSPYQKDALDTVFEHFENMTCRDDITAANLQSRGLRTLRKIPRQKDWTPSHTGNNKPFRHYPPGADVLERFGRDFEQTVCTTQLAQCGHEGDFVDNVFDGLEETTCRDQPPKDGGYFDTSVYDLDDQNSLVYSPSESKDWYPPRLMRKPSWGNTKPSKKPNRKIDTSGYVEGLRAPGRYPRDDDSYRSSSSKARAKHSLERIRAIRERYFSDERYYRDDGHY